MSQQVMKRVRAATIDGTPVFDYGSHLESEQVYPVLSVLGLQEGESLPPANKFFGVRKRQVLIGVRPYFVEVFYSRKEQLYRIFAIGYLVKDWNVDTWEYKVTWTSKDGLTWSEPTFLQYKRRRKGERSVRITEADVQPRWEGLSMCVELKEDESSDGDGITLPFLLPYCKASNSYLAEMIRYLWTHFPDNSMIPTEGEARKTAPNDTTFTIRFPKSGFAQRFRMFRYRRGESYFAVIKGEHDPDTIARIASVRELLEAKKYVEAGEVLGSDYLTQYGVHLATAASEGYDVAVVLQAAQAIRDGKYDEAGTQLRSELLKGLGAQAAAGETVDNTAVLAAAELLTQMLLEEAGTALGSEWLKKFSAYLASYASWNFDPKVIEGAAAIIKRNHHDSMLGMAEALQATGLVEPGRLVVEPFSEREPDYWPVAVGICTNTKRLLDPESEGYQKGSWDFRPVPARTLRMKTDDLNIETVIGAVFEKETDEETAEHGAARQDVVENELPSDTPEETPVLTLGQPTVAGGLAGGLAGGVGGVENKVLAAVQ